MVPAVGDVLVRSGRADSMEMYFVVRTREGMSNGNKTVLVEYIPQRIVTQVLTASVEILATHGYHSVGMLTKKGLERVRKHLPVNIYNEFKETEYFVPNSEYAVVNPTGCLVEEKVLRLFEDNGIELDPKVEDELMAILATPPMKMVDITDGIEAARKIED